MRDVLLDALLDSLKILPFLFLIYLLIEIIESSVNAARYNRMLSGKFAPLVGAAFGLVPQCGFSVMTAKLYDRGMITSGTLLAVFIATSDEAFAIMLTGGAAVKMLPVLLAVKFAFALIVGYGANFLLGKRERLVVSDDERKEAIGDAHCGHDHGHARADCAERCAAHDHAEGSTVTSADDCASEDVCAHCAKRHHGKWEQYCFTPLRHSLIIFAYLLAVNVVFAILIYFVGENEITRFLSASGVWQPFIAGLVGLIPNCASSVIISRVYVLGGISFGSLVAGLSVNAGLGVAVLLKNRKKLGRNLALIGVLYGLSVLLGVAISLIFPAL